MTTSNVYSRHDGVLCRVVEVNETFAKMTFLNPDGTVMNYSMPVAEYDTNFAKTWHPARPEDFYQQVLPVRPPKNGEAIWAAQDAGNPLTVPVD